MECSVPIDEHNISSFKLIVLTVLYGIYVCILFVGTYSRVYRQRGFSLRSKGVHEIMWRWHVKIQNMAKFSRKIAFPIGTRGQKRSNFPKMSYISRNSPVVQKLEQLEQNRKKHLKAHSAGYRRLHIGFKLKSVFKVLEVIKGQNSVLCENSVSWINLEVLKLEPLF